MSRLEKEIARLVEALNTLSSGQLRAQKDRQRLYDNEKVTGLETEIQNLKKTCNLYKESEAKLKVFFPHNLIGGNS